MPLRSLHGVGQRHRLLAGTTNALSITFHGSSRASPFRSFGSPVLAAQNRRSAGLPESAKASQRPTITVPTAPDFVPVHRSTGKADPALITGTADSSSLTRAAHAAPSPLRSSGSSVFVAQNRRAESCQGSPKASQCPASQYRRPRVPSRLVNVPGKPARACPTFFRGRGLPQTAPNPLGRA